MAVSESPPLSFPNFLPSSLSLHFHIAPSHHPHPVIPIPLIPIPLIPIPSSPFPSSPFPSSPFPSSPFPSSPFPESPFPESPLPESPLPESPFPESPFPESPFPESPLPESPLPESPFPESPFPEPPLRESPFPESPFPESNPRPNRIPVLRIESPFPESPFPESPFPESPFPKSPFPESPFPESPFPESTRCSPNRFPMIQPYNERKEAAEKFLKEELQRQGKAPGLIRLEFAPIQDPVPERGGSDPSLDCIVVSGETVGGAAAINRTRAANQIAPLHVVVASTVPAPSAAALPVPPTTTASAALAADVSKLSSSLLREQCLGTFLPLPRQVRHSFYPPLSRSDSFSSVPLNSPEFPLSCFRLLLCMPAPVIK
ncbi:unnamed protein product [Closterium sp. Naga37s-1]|nr:unnamed protein product [Closterium sp. Naga37s-1]